MSFPTSSPLCLFPKFLCLCSSDLIPSLQLTNKKSHSAMPRIRYYYTFQVGSFLPLLQSKDHMSYSYLCPLGVFPSRPPLTRLLHGSIISQHQYPELISQRIGPTYLLVGSVSPWGCKTWVERWATSSCKFCVPSIPVCAWSWRYHFHHRKDAAAATLHYGLMDLIIWVHNGQPRHILPWCTVVRLLRFY